MANKFLLILAIALIGVSGSTASAQLGSLKRAIKKVEKKKKKTTQKVTKSNSNTTSVEDKVTKKSVGRIVFSKQPIDPKNPTNLTTEFSAGDHIYGLIILDIPLREYINYPKKYPSESTMAYATRIDRPYLAINNLLNGQHDSNQYMVFSKDKAEGALETVPMDKYFFFDIAPEASKQRTYKYENIHFLKSFAYVGDIKPKIGPEYYSSLLGIQGPGSYKFDISVQVKIHEESDRVSGSFTVSGKDFSFYKNVAKNVSAAAAATAVFPKSKWKNLRVERSVKAAYRKAGKKGQIIKLAFDSIGWTNQRNRLGLIEYRSIFTYLGLKHRDGSCEIVNFAFQQTYLGRNRFGATRVRGKYDSPLNQKVPCEVLTK